MGWGSVLEAFTLTPLRCSTRGDWWEGSDWVGGIYKRSSLAGRHFLLLPQLLDIVSALPLVSSFASSLPSVPTPLSFMQVLLPFSLCLPYVAFEERWIQPLSQPVLKPEWPCLNWRGRMTSKTLCKLLTFTPLYFKLTYYLDHHAIAPLQSLTVG